MLKYLFFLNMFLFFKIPENLKLKYFNRNQIFCILFLFRNRSFNIDDAFDLLKEGYDMIFEIIYNCNNATIEIVFITLVKKFFQVIKI